MPEFEQGKYVCVVVGSELVKVPAYGGKGRDRQAIILQLDVVESIDGHEIPATEWPPKSRIYLEAKESAGDDKEIDKASQRLRKLGWTQSLGDAIENDALVGCSAEFEFGQYGFQIELPRRGGFAPSNTQQAGLLADQLRKRDLKFPPAPSNNGKPAPF